MPWFRESWHRIRSFIRRDTLEHRLAEELRFHVDQQHQKHLRAGMHPDEARRRALVQFGGVARFRDETRDEFRLAFIQDSVQDLRYGFRGLRRAPAFTVVALLTLTLCIAATTAVFTVVHGVLIKPLPFPDAGALVSLKHTAADVKDGRPVGLSASLFTTYARENRSLRHLGIWSRTTENVTGDVVPEEVTSLNVSSGTLAAAGIQPATGRWFSETEYLPGSAETVILTDGYWRRRFGGNPAIIGGLITVDARPRTIVGIMPATFRFLNESPDLILPLRFELGALTLGGFNFEGLARLAPGVTTEQAIADLDRIVPMWIDAWPSFPGVDRSAFVGTTPLIQPLKQELVGNVRNTLWVLMGTVGIVLLIACANVASLVIVRAESRHHELVTRAALGATRARLARAMLARVSFWALRVACSVCWSRSPVFGCSSRLGQQHFLVCRKSRSIRSSSSSHCSPRSGRR